MPKISIILPVYNAELYLKASINSILSQSFNDFELLLIDDGSTDLSSSICNSYSDKYDFIKCFHQKNTGANKAREYGVSVSRGEWIMFVDADDTLEENALYELYNNTDDTDIVVAFSDYVPKPYILTLEDARKECIYGDRYPRTPWAKLYRSTIFSHWCFDFPIKLKYGEDQMMNIRLLFNTHLAPKFVFKKLYNYNNHKVSVSHIVKRTLDYESIYDQHRVISIPEDKQSDYLQKLTSIRLNGLLAIAVFNSEIIAHHDHPYFSIVEEGISKSGYRLSLFEKTILTNRKPYIIKVTGRLFLVKMFIKYRVQLLVSKL